LNDGFGECIYYIATENLNNQSIIDASNMKIVQNVSFIHYYPNNFNRFCRTLNTYSDFIVGLVLRIICLVLIILCCFTNCLRCFTFNDNDNDNNSNRSLL